MGTPATPTTSILKYSSFPLLRSSLLSTNFIPRRHKFISCRMLRGCQLGRKEELRLLRCRYSLDAKNVPEGEDPEALVDDLRVPPSWLEPSNALEESEWLRVALHKWLDEEYCPEPANVEISNLAARSYYESLMAKQADLGQILLKMVRELETMSFQESFHGPFSSANAAIDLIIQRINSIR